MDVEPKRFKLPHTLVLIYALVAGIYLLGLVLPSGEYTRTEVVLDGKARTVIDQAVPYRAIPKPSLSPAWMLIGPIRGFADGIEIIAFLFIVGGAFAVLQRTQAIEAGIGRLAQFCAGRPLFRRLLIPLLMAVFSLAGSTFGMSEEVIPFIGVFILLARSLGYDSIVGVAIPFLGAAAGFAAAFMNPFTVGIAQGFCKLPLFSGIEYRLLLWALGTSLVIAYVMAYAERVRRDPLQSPVRDLDLARGELQAEAVLPFGRSQQLVLGLVGLMLLGLVVGVLFFAWYIEEIAALFLAVGITAGLLGRMSASDIARAFIDGARDMVSVAFVIACGRSILMIMTEARVLDTVLFYTASAISAVPKVLTAQMMFLTQTGINFFIHSGTAQAALTMPLMSPLAELVGITQQTTVLAFQLCEFVNPILPTSAVTMGVLGLAGISWERWARWFLPLMLLLIVFSLLALIPPVLLEWGPR